MPCTVVDGRKNSKRESLTDAIVHKIWRRQQIPEKEKKIYYTDQPLKCKWRRRAVLKVIYVFRIKCWRMRIQSILGPFFHAWGLVPRSAAKSEEKTGQELDYRYTYYDKQIIASTEQIPTTER